MFTPNHYGLYFTESHVLAAQQERDRDPFDKAWAYLRRHEQTGVEAALWGGLRYRLNHHAPAAAMAVEVFERAVDPALMAGRAVFGCGVGNRDAGTGV